MWVLLYCVKPITTNDSSPFTNYYPSGLICLSVDRDLPNDSLSLLFIILYCMDLYSKKILMFKIFFHDRDINARVWKLNATTRMARISSAMIESQPVVISQSTEVYVWGGGKSTPRKIDLFTGAQSAAQISCSRNHFAVLTVEKELYTWTVCS